MIVWQKPNLLLLDEPSNHLDVDTREALATALAEFAGSVLLVSHDRHLLRTTVDSFWIVADGTVQEFDGDLEDYRNWLVARAATARTQIRSVAAETNSTDDSTIDRKAQRRLEAEERQRQATRRKPIEAKIKKIETELETIRLRLQTLNALIADQDFYAQERRDERIKVLGEQGALSKKSDELEDQWLMLHEELEEQEASQA